MNQVLANKSFIHCGFEVEYILTALYSHGYTGFSEKWQQSENGPVKADDDRRYDTDYYSIGQLNKGNDVTVKKAQEEFDRDCNAFDISLNVSILKNGIELYEEVVINSDYSHDDKYDIDQIIVELIKDYSDINSYIEDANRVLVKLTD